MLWEKSSPPSSSSFSISCALSGVFSPLAGLYSNKSLVTHTAVFLCVSQANSETLIIPSLCLPFFCLTQTFFFLFRPWPSSTPGCEIDHCKSRLSLRGHMWWRTCLARVEPGPQTDLRLGTSTQSLIRGLFPCQEPADTFSLDTLMCSYFPCSPHVSSASLFDIDSLCVFQFLFHWVSEQSSGC